MKILAGLDKAFEGEFEVLKELRIGYLPQEPALNDGETVWENIAPAVAEMQSQLDAYNDVSLAMGEPGADVDALMAKMERLQTAIDGGNGWELERTVARAMDALRCPPREAKVAVLSGGERRRVALCRLLLSNPQMLLLDGPLALALRSLLSVSLAAAAARAHEPPRCTEVRKALDASLWLLMSHASHAAWPGSSASWPPSRAPSSPSPTTASSWTT